ncbi:MAG: hypothetical protein Q8P18_04755 [Pseudomonadota bacterium]|nr:hypothetical protein [Pseudomonadota bacterium]
MRRADHEEPGTIALGRRVSGDPVVGEVEVVRSERALERVIRLAGPARGVLVALPAGGPAM